MLAEYKNISLKWCFFWPRLLGQRPIADEGCGVAGWTVVLLQAGLRRGLVHQRVHGRADFPVGFVGSNDQLENRPLPAALWWHC